MSPDRRTRATILGLAPIVLSLHRSFRHSALRSVLPQGAADGNVVRHPVHVDSLRFGRVWCVGIVDDHGDALGAAWCAGPGQRWGYVLPLASVLGRDRTALLKRGRC